MKIGYIYDREFNSSFHSLYGYVFTAFMLLVAGIYVTGDCLRGGSANFAGVMGSMSFIYLIVIPILTMRVFAEERRQRTEQLLYALPVSMGQVVIGKYLALISVLAVPTIIMAFYPPILAFFGDVDLLGAYCALIGFYLCGCALCAVGVFLSSLADNQAIAAGMCFVAMLLLFFLSSLANLVSATASGTLLAASVLVVLLGLLTYSLTRSKKASIAITGSLEAILVLLYILFKDSFTGLFPAIMKRLSVFDRYYVFLDGIFDLTGLVYMVSFIAIFLLLTTLSMEKRRWNG